MKNPLLSVMPFSFDPKTLEPWWKPLTPSEEIRELILAQRKDFYVLVGHIPGFWVAIAREGKYVSPPKDWEPILYKGSLHDEVIPVAEKYIRERDPSFMAGRTK
jgi:hypothetical protein